MNECPWALPHHILIFQMLVLFGYNIKSGLLHLAQFREQWINCGAELHREWNCIWRWSSFTSKVEISMPILPFYTWPLLMQKASETFTKTYTLCFLHKSRFFLFPFLPSIFLFPLPYLVDFCQYYFCHQWIPNNCQYVLQILIYYNFGNSYFTYIYLTLKIKLFGSFIP